MLSLHSNIIILNCAGAGPKLFGLVRVYTVRSIFIVLRASEHGEKNDSEIIYISYRISVIVHYAIIQISHGFIFILIFV